MKQRVLTAALLIPPVLLAVFLSEPWPLWVLAVAAFHVGNTELRRISGLSGFRLPIFGSVLLLAALPIVGWYESGLGGVTNWRWWSVAQEFGTTPGQALTVLCLILGVAAILSLSRPNRDRTPAQVEILTEIGSLWVAAPLVSLVLLKLPAKPGPVWDLSTPVLLALIPVWIGDTLAIFAGRAFGKHPLAPKISPKKTVEGGIANLLGCVSGAVCLSEIIHQPLLVGILAGIATGLLGQAGDLLESALKRSVGVKDSGTLLPGHGGLLDRIDSILLSAPAVALIVVAVGSHGG